MRTTASTYSSQANSRRRHVMGLPWPNALELVAAALLILIPILTLIRHQFTTAAPAMLEHDRVIWFVDADIAATEKALRQIETNQQNEVKK